MLINNLVREKRKKKKKLVRITKWNPKDWILIVQPEDRDQSRERTGNIRTTNSLCKKITRSEITRKVLDFQRPLGTVPSDDPGKKVHVHEWSADTVQNH